MPRERIHHGKLYAQYKQSVPDDSPSTSTGLVSKLYDPSDSSIPKDASITEEPSLDVGWEGESSWVQVSINMSRDVWLSTAKELEEDPSIVSRSIYTDSLTRQEINHLIKTLRRARDAAYGRDE